MTSAAIDDTLAPAEELAALRTNNEQFNDYLRWAWKQIPNRNFFVPYGAGISENGARVYISNDIATLVEGIDCADALLRHETTEWALRTFLRIGDDYENDPRGHRLANRAEHDRVLALLDRPEAWELYTSHINPQVLFDERESLEGKRLPVDLALYPYPEHMVNQMLYHMMRVEA